MKPPIKLNKKLLWDYQIKEEELLREDVLIFYISRVLNNGNLKDVSSIPEELIRKYLPKLHLSQKVRKFWERFLKEE